MIFLFKPAANAFCSKGEQSSWKLRTNWRCLSFARSPLCPPWNIELPTVCGIPLHHIEPHRWEAPAGHLPPSPNMAVLFAKLASLLPVLMVREPRSAAKAPVILSTKRGNRVGTSRRASRVHNAYPSGNDTLGDVNNTRGSLDEVLTTRRAGHVELEGCTVGHSCIRIHGEYCTLAYGVWMSVVSLLQLGTDSRHPLRLSKYAEFNERGAHQTIDPTRMLYATR